jgi:hypothetical protein
MIQVVSDGKFLILSWTGAGAMGLFINLNGDPVCGRSTLQRSSHPLSVCSFSLVFAADHVTALEYVTALLQDQTIVVHNVESQEVVQTVPAPPLPSPGETSLMALLGAGRALAMRLSMSSNAAAIHQEK